MDPEELLNMLRAALESAEGIAALSGTQAHKSEPGRMEWGEFCRGLIELVEGNMGDIDPDGDPPATLFMDSEDAFAVCGLDPLLTDEHVEKLWAIALPTVLKSAEALNAAVLLSRWVVEYDDEKPEIRPKDHPDRTEDVILVMAGVGGELTAKRWLVERREGKHPLLHDAGVTNGQEVFMKVDSRVPRSLCSGLLEARMNYTAQWN